MRDLFYALWPFLQPSNALVLLFAAGGILLLIGRRRTGRFLIGVGAGLGLVILLLPFQSMMLVSLETRFPPPALPDQVDGIVVLGGAIHPINSERWGRPQVSERSERLTETVLLARRYPGAKVVLTGGTWREDTASEAEHAAQFLREMGIPQSSVIVETEARNTHQNAKFSQDLVSPMPGEKWLLVTSASHMPRAVGVFRKLEWQVIPYPVDYFTDGRIRWLSVRAAGAKLHAMDVTARAWSALIAYRLLGLTDHLFPRPIEDAAAENQ